MVVGLIGSALDSHIYIPSSWEGGGKRKGEGNTGAVVGTGDGRKKLIWLEIALGSAPYSVPAVCKAWSWIRSTQTDPSRPRGAHSEMKTSDRACKS